MNRTFLLLVLLPVYSLCQIPNSFSDQEKIYGLSKIWKEVEYNYAYFEKIGSEQWDSLYLEMIKSVQETKNDYEYFRELQKFMASVKDGHTWIRRFLNINLWTTLFHNYLIEFEWIEEKVIVTRINTDKKDEIPIGSELIEIDGMKTMVYMIKNVLPYIPASTDHARMNEAAHYIFDGLENMEYDIKLKTPDDKVISLKIVHYWDKDKDLLHDVYPTRKPRNKVIFKWLDNDVAYLAINNFRDTSVIKEFKKHLPELNNAKKLIIDIRDNGGGNTEIGLEILSFFTKDEFLYSPKQRSRKHLSHNKANGVKYGVADTSKADWIRDAYLDYHNKLYTDSDYSPYKINHEEKRIVIPTLILTSCNTVSAAEGFLVPVERLDHIKIMGETTAGSTGTPYIFDLIGGAKVYVCTLQSIYPNGTEFVGVGIKPDIEIKRTIKGTIELNDEVLEKAIEYLK